eukprot:gene385-biopygen5450
MWSRWTTIADTVSAADGVTRRIRSAGNRLHVGCWRIITGLGWAREGLGVHFPCI